MIRFLVKPTVDKIRKSVKRKYAHMQRLSIPYKRASVYLHKWVIANFKTEGGNVGGWAPFSPRTLIMIERTDPGRIPAKLLQKTSALRQSFVPFATNRDAGVGSDIPYSKSHEEGIGNLPQRRMLPTKPEVIKDVRQIFSDHVKESSRA